MALSCARDDLENGPYEKTLWKLLAFAARYGHQPVTVSLMLTVHDLRQFADAVAGLMDDEQHGLSKLLPGGG